MVGLYGPNGNQSLTGRRTSATCRDSPWQGLFMTLTRFQRPPLYVAALAWANGRAFSDQAKAMGFSLKPDGVVAGLSVKGVEQLLKATLVEGSPRNLEICIEGVEIAVGDLLQRSPTAAQIDHGGAIGLMEAMRSVSRTLMDAVETSDSGLSSFISPNGYNRDEYGIVREELLDKIVAEVKSTAQAARREICAYRQRIRQAKEGVRRLSCEMCSAISAPCCDSGACPVRRGQDLAPGSM